MVEYGFQSFPEMSSLKKVMADSSLNLNSVAMKNRQKSYIGNGLIEKHIKQYYDEPKNFKEFVELSQNTQAKGMEMAIQSHRKAMPHCMGTMFWQLNDCWPGPSWSVIDYYGNEKMAYDVVKENYKPVIAVRDSNIVTIISDLTVPYDGVIQVVIKMNNSNEKAFSYLISVNPKSKTEIDIYKNKKLLKSLNKGNINSVSYL